MAAERARGVQGLAAVGLVALAFGVASYQVLGEWNPFNIGNLVVAGVLLVFASVVGSVQAFLRLRVQATVADSGPTLDAALMAIAIVWGAVIMQVLISIWGVRFDWTFEQRYELAPATHKVVAELVESGPVELTLYTAPGDPRRRATLLLLEQIAHGHASVTAAERDIESSPQEEDYYGIGSSNSVVVTHGEAWQLVERPTEGALFEALSLLQSPSRKLIYVTAGTGEGDLERSDDTGFSGLRAALETEGYELRPLPTAIFADIPHDADALMVISPERRMTDAALSGLRGYLETRGGRLIAFLEPGRDSGVEEILAGFGLTSPDALVIDPASGPVEGDAEGLNPIANAYASHPISRDLNANRMTFFRHARSFVLSKPEPNDKVAAAVYSSSQAWLSDDTSNLNRRLAPVPPPGTYGDYRALVVGGVFERGGKQVRIAAFGDSTFASNRYLRALFNLDLVVNAVHWALEREPEITIRPKAGSLLQFPVPVQSALNALYGIGLLVPELLVVTGVWVWLRRRSA